MKTPAGYQPAKAQYA